MSDEDLRGLERASAYDRTSARQLERERIRRGLPRTIVGTKRGAWIFVAAIEASQDEGVRFYLGDELAATGAAQARPTNVGYCYPRGRRTVGPYPAATKGEPYDYPDSAADWLGAMPHVFSFKFSGFVCFYQERGSCSAYRPRLRIPVALWHELVKYLVPFQKDPA